MSTFIWPAMQWVSGDGDWGSFAWLMFGSLQLMVVAVLAYLLVCTVRRSAIWSHRVWLTVLLLTIAFLPVHVSSIAWWTLEFSRDGLATEQARTLAPLAEPAVSPIVQADASLVSHVDQVKTQSRDLGITEPSVSMQPVHSRLPQSTDVISESRVAKAKTTNLIQHGWKVAIASAWLIYGLIATWLVARCLLGMHKLSAMWRDSHALGDSTTATFIEVARRLKLRHNFSVRSTKRVTMPLVYGAFNCRILVPDDFEQWTKEEQEAVAYHELAHVQRCDLAVELLSQLLCAIYWFHPASWLMRRQLRETRELATDETVVRCGVSSTAYAYSIVAILDRLSATKDLCAVSPAVAMSLHSNVEQRLDRILSNSPTSRFKRRGLALLTILCVAACLTCFRLVAADPATAGPIANAQESSSSAQVSTAKTASKTGSNETVEPPVSKGPWDSIAQNEADLLSRIRDCEVLHVEGDAFQALLSVSGQVRAADGKPVEGAIVLLRESSTQRISSQPAKYLENTERHLVRTRDVFARTVTDGNGDYRFEQVKAPTLEFGNPWRCDVVAGHPSWGVGWQSLPSKGDRVRTDKNITVVLNAVANIAGRYVTPDDQPMTGAVMNVPIVYRDQATPSIPPEFDLQMSQLTPRAVAADDGTFAFRNLPVDCIALVWGPQSQEWLTGFQCVATSQSVRPGPHHLRILQRTESNVVHSPFKVEANAGAKIPLKVVGPDARPIAGVRVSFASAVDYVTTQADGSAELRVATGLIKLIQSGTTPQVRLRVGPAVDSDFLDQKIEVPVEAIETGRVVDVTLQPGVRVSGVVQDAAGKPVENIRVAAVDRSDVHGAVTAADGRYVIKLPDGKHRLTFFTDMAGIDLPSTSQAYANRTNGKVDFPHLEVDVANGVTKDVGVFTVNRIPAIEVEVKRPDGRAAVQADVVIMDSDVSQVPLSIPNPIPSLRREVSKHAVTDALGRIQLLPFGKPTRRATIVAKFFDGSEYLTGEQTIPESRDSKVVVMLNRPKKIEGRVLKDGQPVAGAVVLIEEHTSSGAARSRLVVDTLVTDTEGRYHGTGSIGRSYGMRLESVPGLRESPNQSPGIAEDSDTVLRFKDTLLVTYNEEVRGVVLNKNRQPIAGARLHVLGPSSTWINHSATSQLTTDDRGRFHLKHMPAGEHYVEVMVPAQLTPSSAVPAFMSATFKVRAGDQAAEILFAH